MNRLIIIHMHYNLHQHYKLRYYRLEISNHLGCITTEKFVPVTIQILILAA